ncbi:MAG: cysteine hydrolase [Pseudomonadota bacterium]
MMMLGYALGSVVIIAIVWLADGVRRIGAVSQGTPIGERPGTALLLIDLQSVFWDHGPYSDASKSDTETVVLDEIDSAKAKGHPVVAVRQEWSIPSTKAIARLTMKGQAIEGKPGNELVEPFAELVDSILVKRVQDSFETGELDELLAMLEVGRLRVVGLDFNYCIQKTALAARNRGYEVTVVKGGTLASAPTARAEERMASRGVVLY